MSTRQRILSDISMHMDKLFDASQIVALPDPSSDKWAVRVTFRNQSIDFLWDESERVQQVRFSQVS